MIIRRHNIFSGILFEMEKAFIDESGVTGFTKKSSKYFNITAFLTKDFEGFQKKVKKFLKKLFSKNKKRPHYIHASQEEKKDILALIKILKENSFKVICTVCKKKDFFDYKTNMANFVRNLPNECREVVISKYDTRKSVQEYIISSNQERKVAFQINQDNVLLQIADLVSWSIYRFYEFGDAEYFDLITEFVQIKQNP